MKKKYSKQFWVTNISKRNVALADLAITLKTRKSCNLLDPRYYSYTEEQLEKSAASGSIFKKSRFIKVRKYAPAPVIKPGLYVSTHGRPAVPVRSNVEIEEKTFDEFKSLDAQEAEETMSEERFAEENADMDAYDGIPGLKPGRDE